MRTSASSITLRYSQTGFSIILILHTLDTCFYLGKLIQASLTKIS